MSEINAEKGQVHSSEITDDMISELLGDNDFSRPVKEEDDVISIPEEEEGGWYDIKTLVDYDESTSDEDVEKITENTGEDRMSE